MLRDYKGEWVSVQVCSGKSPQNEFQIQQWVKELFIRTAVWQDISKSTGNIEKKSFSPDLLWLTVTNWQYFLWSKKHLFFAETILWKLHSPSLLDLMLPHGEVGCTRNKRFWVLFQDRTYSHERKRCCCLQQREIIFTITYAGICVCIFSEAFIYIVLLPCFPTPKSPPSSNVICYSPF